MGQTSLQLPRLPMPPIQATTVLPNTPRSLRHNFSWTLAGNLTYGACQWLMMVSIARLGDPQMVGTFTVAQAITAPIVLFSNLQLRVIQAADSKERFQFGHYLALRYLTTIAALGTIVIFAFVHGYRSESCAVILIVALAKCIESLSDIYFGLLQHHEEMSRIAKSMIIKGGLSLMLLAGTLRWTHNLIYASLAMLLAWLLVFALYDARAPHFCPASNPKPSWDRRALSTIVRLAFPLGITMLLISLNANLPRYFMEHFQGTRRLGLFSALTAIQVGGMLVVMALGNAVLPRLAKSYEDADWPRFRCTLVCFLLVSLTLGAATLLAVIVAGDRLIAMVFGPDYAGQNPTLVWLASAAAISYCAAVFGYASIASGRIKFQPFAYGSAVAITALGCFWLVPPWGGLGAAISMAGAAVVCALWYVLSFVGTARELRNRSSQRAAFGAARRQIGNGLLSAPKRPEN